MSRRQLHGESSKVLFCNNCENEAAFRYTTEGGVSFYLCDSCKNAFELGQVNAENDSLRSIDADDDYEEPGDDVCDLCMTSKVHAERTTYCGKTIGMECGCEESNEGGTCGNEDCEACQKGVAENG